MSFLKNQWAIALGLGVALIAGATAQAENCITQSQMLPEERTALADAARTLALKVQANDLAAVKSLTIPEFASNFNGIASTVSSASPKLSGDSAQVDQIYILDASMNKPNPDGSAPDADFVCTLNKGSSESRLFDPPGFLRENTLSRWCSSRAQIHGWWRCCFGRMAPVLPGSSPVSSRRESSAAGHDGLWYWSQARSNATNKQPWISFIYYQEAQQLLRPAVFVSSTHLENLRAESANANPPDIGDGHQRGRPTRRPRSGRGAVSLHRDHP